MRVAIIYYNIAHAARPYIGSLLAERPDETHQEPGTSTPAADTDTSRYQSPTVQGAKHEECSWFPVDDALKISPTFATIYKTEKFSELLSLIKTTWT